MNDSTERNLGPQPIGRLLEELGLTAQDLVTSSTEQLTHKMVAKACKGRRLSANVQSKVLRALNAAADREYDRSDLFNYRN
ncbi:MAG: hypothetical protein R3236_02275 [Phycisphaeraceae bacterium]|nr:hypothetical protein [Phycisphaeraceae bacterium]